MEPQDIIHRLTYHEPSLLGKNKLQEYGILIPMVTIDESVHVVFEKRALNMREQPGDVCFPGGRMDKNDIDARACALRETSEELGIHTSEIEQVYKLGHGVSAERIIHLFAGFIPDMTQLHPNLDEVDHVFTVPLSFFISAAPEVYTIAFDSVPEKNFPFELIQGGKRYDWKPHAANELFYRYGDYAIWGLTAYLIKQFIGILQEP